MFKRDVKTGQQKPSDETEYFHIIFILILIPIHMHKRKEKRPTAKPKGPKYTRYFYVYSDKMITDMLLTPTNVLTGLTGSPFSGDILLDDEFLSIELPQTSGDILGKYGVLVVPEYKCKEFLENGPEFKEKRLAKRELDPVESRLVYLVGLDLKNAGYLELGKHIANTYEGSSLILYRTTVSSTPMHNLLSRYGHTHEISFPYLELGNLPFNQVGIEVPIDEFRRIKTFGIEQKPRIHIFGFNDTCKKGPLCTRVSELLKIYAGLIKEAGIYEIDAQFHYETDSQMPGSNATILPGSYNKLK
ncbi:hypothetical protein JXB31_04260 [Candidatus Woesearchaeota archaeon]|nr:hypothetical protein [Candidatus Woesearchaeota archaeon]